jgi:glycosyltransferase involved in cell wall biosynthesis
MRDLAGDAALRFDPFDESAIAATLLRLPDEPSLRARLSQQAVTRAASFTWERTAHETLAAYAQGITQ